MNTRLPPSEDEVITRVVVRMNATMTGVALGLLSGGGLFIATLWLVLKGGPDPGPHLSLLGQYFPGYSVTLSGCFVGLIYGFALGFISGLLLGGLYNKVAR